MSKTVKKNWIDNENEENTRPTSIQVQLLANGDKYEEVTLSEENNWTYTWSNLPKKSNGSDIKYTIEEVGEVTGYTKTLTVKDDTTIITNTLNSKKEFDLALRKFIVQIGKTQYSKENGNSRAPEVDISPLTDGDQSTTTAIYKHSKTPLKAAVGDKVIYTIRVYNEGDISGYATKITDHLPEELEFVEYTKSDGSINDKFKWVKLDDRTITTNYLENTLLEAFDGSKLDYADVQIECRIKENAPVDKNFTNIAAITEEKDENKDDVKDRDSEGGNEKLPSDEDLPKYNDHQEDDDDFEKVYIEKERTKEYDLSLRKFITAVNSNEITERIPNVNTDNLVNKKSTTAEYEHPKDPVLVCTNDIVKYTLRIYNEGPEDAYASVIRDDIPEGLEFVKYEDGDGSINAKYGWKLLDENGDYTENVNNAKYILTDYLSKDKGENNLLKAFDPSTMTSLDYRDVEVEFRVTEPNTSDRIIINYAQIVEETDDEGNTVTDRDSTPGKWVDGEDDQDIEKIRVKYFDLALRKWVTQAIIIQNGNETITQTNHKAEDDPEEVVKVDLKKKNLSELVVKFRYSIRVTNQGEIAGYAKEIKDYIPNGLKFEQVDNPTWAKSSDGTIVTNELADTLLQPGESAEVTVVLTWINSSTNMGLKNNIAEISRDYNSHGTPDIDSTPDNEVLGEDDIDDAPVMLTVKTGSAQITYVIIALAFISIIAVGGKIIKEKVVENKK